MIEAIVAVYGDWGIGAGGTQPVVVSADRKHFREVTGGSAVIVGRKTLADFPGGRPLKNRTNIVLTRQTLAIEGAAVVHSPEEALAECAGLGRVFVIGGESVYRALFPHIQKIFVTKLDCIPHSDAFFPNLDADPDWEVESEGPVQTDENGVRFRFLTYVRRRSAMEQTALDWLRRTSPLTNVGTVNAIARRSFFPFYAGEDGVVGYDVPGGLWYALGSVSGHLPPKDCTTEVFITDREETVSALQEAYGLRGSAEYRIVVFPGTEPPQPEASAGLDIRRPTDEELARISATYHMAGAEELRRDRSRGDLFAAHNAEGGFVGYMGIHSEGSMGILQIFPEHRRHGYAEELECFMLSAVLSRGMIPYAQIAPDNAASLSLQRKLGLVEAPGSIWFVWP